jgi:clan AA aspartic protease
MRATACDAGDSAAAYRGASVCRVTEEITLTNVKDEVRVETGILKEARQVTVNAVVDTGAGTLVISEELRQKLGLELAGTKWAHLANGTEAVCSLTEPVLIRWKERDCACRAVVIPGAEQILLGAIPLEDMDLLVDPVHQCLVGAHGDVVEGALFKIEDETILVTHIEPRGQAYTKKTRKRRG